ncbi:MAG TPA: hypothetical protein IAA13_04040 [Candidatus Alistipes merdigallinarum]|nr:hypothetical protein [Candidatus Alistipes merdigallinarum]
MSQGKVDWSSPVARVAKPFGNEGEAVVALFDNFPEDFDMKEPLFAVIDGLTVPLFFDRFERRGNRKAIVLISDFYTEKRVAELVGCELFGERNRTGSGEYESEDEDNGLLYLDELVGFEAVLGPDREGRIEDFIDSDNPLFLVRIGEKEIYVPAADDLIEEIDVETKRIVFDLPDGLIELND